MENRTARLTILIDPRKKEIFEEICAAHDLTPSQVVRKLVRQYIIDNAGGRELPDWLAILVVFRDLLIERESVLQAGASAAGDEPRRKDEAACDGQEKQHDADRRRLGADQGDPPQFGPFTHYGDPGGPGGGGAGDGRKPGFGCDVHCQSPQRFAL